MSVRVSLGNFGGRRTEDEFFRRSQHIYSEGDFILINLEADPAHKGAGDTEKERHCGNESEKVARASKM